jgi:hypothetical protein
VALSFVVDNREKEVTPGAAAFGVKAAVFEFSYSHCGWHRPKPQRGPNFDEFVGRLESTLAKVHQNKEL